MKVTGFLARHLKVVLLTAGTAAFIPWMAVAMMSTPGGFQVSESGAAVYTIPIKVPPGVAGMEPKLALVYNSQAGNGLLGVGWSLSGLSAITRCPRTMAQDGVRGGVNYDANDRFCLDGQRLMLISGSTYGAGSTEYRTEHESFSKIVASSATITYSSPTTGVMPESFTVKTKAGLTLEYGTNANSQILAQGKTTVRVWAVNKISDSKGNYLTVSYHNDGNTTGEYRANRIEYAKHTSKGAAYDAYVEFVYETQPRPDPITAYEAGSKIYIGKRLTNIKTYSYAGTGIQDYRLAYGTSPFTSRSILQSVTQCDATNCFPASNLTYQPAQAGWQVSSSFNSPYHFAIDGKDGGSRFVDLNGDGLMDFVYNRWGGGG